MANFVELAKAVAQSQNVNTQQKISELKARRDSAKQMMDIAIAQEELKKNEQDAVRDQIKFEEKRAKIKAQLVKDMMSQQAGPVAVGADLIGQFAPETEAEAAGLPILGDIPRQV